MPSPTHRTASSAPRNSKAPDGAATPHVSPAGEEQGDSGKGASERAGRVLLSRYVVFLALAGLGCMLDLFTKRWVFGWPQLSRRGEIWWLIEPYVGFQTALNTGGLFGLGEDQVLWLAALSVVALLGIGYWLFVAGAAHDRLLTVALGVVVGGILGNLYDRLGLSGVLTQEGKHAVRDWILLRYGDYTWPNFNIADSLLVCGAGLLIWHALRKPVPQKPSQAAQQVAD